VTDYDYASDLPVLAGLITKTMFTVAAEQSRFETARLLYWLLDAMANTLERAGCDTDDLREAMDATVFAGTVPVRGEHAEPV
jgi:hypothetical protein